MYPETGPSRTAPPPGPSYPPAKVSPGENGRGRAGPSRWDGGYDSRDKDERTNRYRRGQDFINRPYHNNFSRLPYRPNTFRHDESRTPSPPRRGFDRDRGSDRDKYDVKDRLGLDSSWRGGGGPNGGLPDGSRRLFPNPRDRDRDWDKDRDRGDRRWGDRRDDRYREEPSRNSLSLGQTSPGRPPQSPPYPPRGPKSTSGQTPPTYPSRIPSGPRSTFSTPSAPREDRERHGFPSRDLDRVIDNATAGPGPSTTAYNISAFHVVPPRAPRSMRGSSSPVEIKRRRDLDETPATVPHTHVSLPLEVKEELLEEARGLIPQVELEEGEVVSPVRAVRAATGRSNESRRSRSRERDRDRHWDRDRKRDRDRDWDRDRNQRSSPHKSRTWGPGRGSASPTKSTSKRSTPPGGKHGEDGWNTRQRGRSFSPEKMYTNGINSRRRSARKPSGELTSFEKASENPTEDIGTALYRPPTPLDPPPPRDQSLERSRPIPEVKQEIAKLSDGFSARDGLKMPSERPDTPVDPPPETSNLRPQTPSLPPPPDVSMEGSQYNNDPLSNVEQPSTFLTKTMEPHQDVTDVEKDQDSTSLCDNDDSANMTIKGGLQNADMRDLSSSLNDQPLSTPSPPHDSPSITRHAPKSPYSQDEKLAMNSTIHQQENVEQSSRQGVHAAHTSPSETVITPAQPPQGSSTDVEIVLDEHSQSIATAELETESHNLPTFRTEDTQEPTPVDPVRRVTIAERRSVVLPATAGPLSSPFGDRFPLNDPMPTGGSIMESTDADTEFGPKTADIDIMSDISDSAMQEMREAGVISAIKAAQAKPINVDVDTIIEWNIDVGPTPSTRIRTDLTSLSLRDVRLDEIVWPLCEQQVKIVNIVALVLQREKAAVQADIDRLKTEYRELDDEWKVHCDMLDSLMEKRGPPPADLYAAPNILPVATMGGPGSIPITPIDDSFGARGNRRRAAGDAVTTEAEFEAILAGLADTAAKDPNFRASKTTAVVPDMIPLHDRRVTYDDDNDLVTDPLAFYDYAGISEPIWTEEERAFFLRRYLAYPKQFGRIADGIPDKTASECVLYYYRTKKKADYKGLLASRRGDKKKKALPIKKGGKSSALLADLNRQKPTINPGFTSTAGPRSATTPGKNRDDPAKRGSQSKGSGTTTPGLEGSIRRRKGMEDDDLVDSSANPSRAGSETPSAAKARMRLSVKTVKRPRVSSVSGASGTVILPTPSDAFIGMPHDGPPPTGTELLPPVKRAGKRRKVADPNDPSSIIEEKEMVKEKDPSKPTRRTATNSYWSVEEKRKFRELVAVHGANIKAISAELTGKSERQVGNFYDAHRQDMRLDDVAQSGDASLGDIPRAKAPSDQRQNGNGQPALYSRSIYDVHPSGHRSTEVFGMPRYPAEPRLRMFPPSPHLGLPSLASANSDPNKQQPPRVGGMRISALLNDDIAEGQSAKPQVGKSYDAMDAASDGTISERDAEGGVNRPSPRSIPPVPVYSRQGDYDDRPTHSGPRRLSTGSYDRGGDPERFRASSAQPQSHPHPYDPAMSWSRSSHGSHPPPPHFRVSDPRFDRPPHQHDWRYDANPPNQVNGYSNNNNNTLAPMKAGSPQYSQTYDGINGLQGNLSIERVRGSATL